jgi:hypothetical protein
MFDNDHSYTPEGFLAQKIILISSMSFLGINYGMGLLLTFFLFFDTLFGIAKAITLYGWVAVNKNKLLFGIGTKVLVLFIPISLALSGALLGFNLKALVALSMYTLIANDAISCYTNLLSIKKKQDYKNKDLIEMLINFLRSLIYSSITSMMKKIKNGVINNIEEKEDENEPKGN